MSTSPGEVIGCGTIGDGNTQVAPPGMNGVIVRKNDQVSLDKGLERVKASFERPLKILCGHSGH